MEQIRIKKNNKDGNFGKKQKMNVGREDHECEKKMKKRKRWNKIFNSQSEAVSKKKKSRRTTAEDIRVFFGTEDSH